MRRPWFVRWALCLACLLAAPFAGAQDAPVPVRTLDGSIRRIQDFANVIPDERESEIIAQIAELERAGDVQMVIATQPWAAQADLDGYAYGLLEAWGVGNAGRRDGLIVLIVTGQRKVVVHARADIDSVINAQARHELVHDVIVPELHRNGIGPEAYQGGRFAAAARYAVGYVAGRFQRSRAGIVSLGDPLPTAPVPFERETRRDSVPMFGVLLGLFGVSLLAFLILSLLRRRETRDVSPRSSTPSGEDLDREFVAVRDDLILARGAFESRIAALEASLHGRDAQLGQGFREPFDPDAARSVRARLEALRGERVRLGGFVDQALAAYDDEVVAARRVSANPDVIRRLARAALDRLHRLQDDYVAGLRTIEPESLERLQADYRGIQLERDKVLTFRADAERAIAALAQEGAAVTVDGFAPRFDAVIAKLDGLFAQEGNWPQAARHVGDAERAFVAIVAEARGRAKGYLDLGPKLARLRSIFDGAVLRLEGYAARGYRFDGGLRSQTDPIAEKVAAVEAACIAQQVDPAAIDAEIGHVEHLIAGLEGRHEQNLRTLDPSRRAAIADQAAKLEALIVDARRAIPRASEIDPAFNAASAAMTVAYAEDTLADYRLFDAVVMGGFVALAALPADGGPSAPVWDELAVADFAKLVVAVENRLYGCAVNCKRIEAEPRLLEAAKRRAESSGWQEPVSIEVRAFAGAASSAGVQKAAPTSGSRPKAEARSHSPAPMSSVSSRAFVDDDSGFLSRVDEPMSFDASDRSSDPDPGPASSGDGGGEVGSY